MKNIHEISDEYQKIVDDWFVANKYSQIVKYVVYNETEFKINNQLDLGRLKLLTDDEKMCMVEEGVSDPVDLRIFLDQDALDAMSETPELVKLAIHRVLEGFAYDFEKDKAKITRPVICEHANILGNFDVTTVTELYRFVVGDIASRRKNKE